MKHKTLFWIFISLFFSVSSLSAQVINESDGEKTDSLEIRQFMTTNSGVPILGDNYRPLVIPPSPNASALSKFAECPISYYTGTPNINIPLFELKAGDFTLPITLNYHASGIKVAQEASSVGLGWVLSAGGCIVREMRGYDDFRDETGVFGYYWVNNYPKNESSAWDIGYIFDTHAFHNYILNDQTHLNFTQSSPNYNTYMLYAGGNESFDLEPDVFHFNFVNHTGSMFFKNGSRNLAKPVIQQVQEYLDFTYDIEKDTWNATDGFGNNFYFGAKEKTAIYSRGSSGGEFPKNSISLYLDKKYYAQDQRQPEVTTAWYLDSVVTATRQKIFFLYQKEILNSVPSVSENVNTIFSSTYNNKVREFMGSYYVYTYARTEQLFLSGITCNNTMIQLGSAPRYDIKSDVSGVDPKRLAYLEIKDGESLIKDIQFFHSYLGPSGNIDRYKHRMMLDSLRFTGSSGRSVDPQTIRFEYNRNPLPLKYSSDVDFWGYYTEIKSRFNSTTWGKKQENVQNNQTTIPPGIVNYNWDYHKDEPKVIYGKDRSPDANKMQNGLLQSIRYPTGAAIRFTYEPHEFANPFKACLDEKILAADTVKSNIFQIEEIMGQNFSLEKRTAVKISGAVHLAGNYDEQALAGCAVKVKKIETNVIVETFYFGGTDNIKDNKITEEKFLWLDKGEYQFSFFKTIESNYSLFASAKGYESKEYNSGGGLRIRELCEIENERMVNYKTYNYTQNYKSSGILLSAPNYFLSYNLIYNKVDCTGFDCPPIKVGPKLKEFLEYLPAPGQEDFKILCVHAKSETNIKGVGSTVGYSFVEETYGGIQSSGKVVYSYTNKAGSPISWAVPGISQRFDQDNGLLENKAIYDKDGYKVQYTEYKYGGANYYATAENQNPMLNPFRVFRIPTTDNAFRVQYYILPYGYVRKPAREDNYSYFNNGRDSLLTTKLYTYNKINLLPDEIKTYTSTGDTLISKKIYAQDSQSYIADLLCERHMVNLPIEELSYKNRKVVTGVKTLYFDTLSMILPRYINTLQLPKTYESGNYQNYYHTEIAFDRYNTWGRPLQISEKGLTTSYLWSYHGQYPVAEIKNAAYTEVESKFGGKGSVNQMCNNIAPSDMEIEKLNRLGTQLPNALISTYTFFPLKGMSSQITPNKTGTFFEYDSHGGLQKVRDTENRILKFYKYFYK